MEEITAEYATTDLLTPVELRVVPSLRFAARTDLGRQRENNEDKFEFFLSEDDRLRATRGSVFVVCDGMGGHAAGQIASELSAKTFIDSYLRHTSDDPAVAGIAAIHVAQRYVLDIANTIPSRKGMGTTLSAVACVQDKAYVFQIGDSRVYRLRDGVLEQVTTDHNWVEQVVAAGTMSREDAEQHPYRNMITRCIGHDEDFRPEVFTLDLAVGDVFLVCSDGVSKHVPDAQMAEIIRSVGPSQAVWDLVNAALLDGGSDNATAILVHVDALAQV